MNPVKKLFACIVFMCMVCLCYAQSETVVEHGLEITTFNDNKKFYRDFDDVWKDKDGQLWVINMETFRRFDGKEFEFYTPTDTNKRANMARQLSKIRRDKKGNIWLTSMGSGFVRYNPQTETYTRVKVDSSAVIDLPSWTLEIDSYGTVWSGGEQGLFKITDGEPFKVEHLLPASPALDIKPMIDSLISSGKQLAEITKVENNQLLSKSFTITEEQKQLTILAQGQLGFNEAFRPDSSLFDYGWITNTEGDTVWKMDVIGSYPGGTTFENVLDVDHIKLPSGEYQIHFKTDKNGAFGSWKAFDIGPSWMPTIPEWWGIQILESNEKLSREIDKTLEDFMGRPAYHTEVAFIYKEDDGTIWVHGRGLQKIVRDADGNYSFDTYFRLDFAHGFPRFYRIGTICTYDKDHLWVTGIDFDGKFHIGLLNKKDKSFREIKAPISFQKPPRSSGDPYNLPLYSIMDKDRNLWLGGVSVDGLFRLSPPFVSVEEEGETEVTVFKGNGKLTSIKGLEIDDFNNLWVGTWTNYLHKINLDPLPYKKFDFAQASQLDTITTSSIVKDLQGNYWISLLARDGFKKNLSGNGRPSFANLKTSIIKLNGQTGDFEEYIGSFEDISFRLMLAVDVLKDGRIVFFDWRNIHYYNPETKEIQTFLANNLRGLGIGRRHFMINDSLLMIQNYGNEAIFNVFQNTIDRDFYKDLKQHPAGGRAAMAARNMKEDLFILMSGGEGGIFSMEENKMGLVKKSDPYEISLYDVFFDRKDKLWLGGYNLYTDFDSSRFRTAITNPELHPYIQGATFIDDSKSNIWAFNREGITRFNPETGVAYFPPRLQTMKLSGRPGYRHQDGSISLRGKYEYSNPDEGFFYLFHPDSVSQDKAPPKIVFDYMLSGGEEGVDTTNLSWFGLEDSYEFDHDRSSITIRYKGIQYNDSEGVTYSYRLRGSSNEWVDVGNEQIARFLNLSAGDYTFELKSANGDGVWSEVSQLAFRINPPWWLSWWAKTIYALIAIGVLAYYLIDARRKVAEKEKQLAKEQAINLKLQQTDKLKDEFLANTSHELRTPLNGIIGISDSMIDGATGPLNSDAISNLGLISNSGRRLSNLVNDILDFSKIRNQDLVLQSRPVDLYAIVDVVLKLSAPLVQHKELELINSVDKALPPVEADENRLQQILHNLVGNAVKFSESGSVEVSALEKEGKLEVSVTDTGIGIKRENLDKIFNSFEQGDGSTARQFGGTGLGLAVTRQLVELHGGQITVESAPGEGSTFSFTLPISKEEVVGAHAAPAQIIPVAYPTQNISETNRARSNGEKIATSNGKQYRVLIVDDEPINLQVLDNHLKMHNFQVTQASSGMQALDIMKADPNYDLLILDIMMPKMSGYEVCEHLRKMFKSHELPVVMLTAKNRVNDLVEGFTSGANDYLTKPFSKDELISRIKTHLELSQISKAYGRFVPHDFLELIGKESIVYTQLGDQSVDEMTILFSDIRSYTTLSEQMTPEENFRFINSYLQKVGPEIQKYNGFVNQYYGDGMMALFKESPLNALEASIGIQEAIASYNQERIKKGRIPIRTGIGFHSGGLMLGVMGDANRHDTGVISDAVNTAARLEGLTKMFGATIILSENSFNDIPEKDRVKYQFRFLGKVQVKGRTQPLGIYECVDGETEDIRNLKLQTRADFSQGIELYTKQDFSGAAGLFRKVLAQNEHDKAAQFYLTKSAENLLSEMPEGWNGVIKLDVK